MVTRKRFGQHFLTDPRILARIADAVQATPADTVLEIGPGPGGLTRALLERAGRVVAIEKDRDLAAVLRRELPDLVLVEGSGGVLVELDGQQHTIADLARELQGRAGEDVGTVVVTRPDLGTLNHTLLTLEALHHRGVRVSGVVLGSWPAHPDPVQESNRDYLADLPDVSGHHIPLLGAVPAGWNVGVS